MPLSTTLRALATELPDRPIIAARLEELAVAARRMEVTIEYMEVDAAEDVELDQRFPGRREWMS